MKLTAIPLIIALAIPAHAGGPVLIEDEAEAAPVVAGKKDWIVPLAILILIAAAAGGGSSGTAAPCVGDDGGDPGQGGC